MYSALTKLIQASDMRALSASAVPGYVFTWSLPLDQPSQGIFAIGGGGLGG